MQQPYLELRTRRELGTILSDSFAFVRINLKPLINVLLKTAGVFFLITVLFSGIYQYGSSAQWVLNEPLYFGISFLLLIIGGMLFFASSAAAIFAFMENYTLTKGQVEEESIIQTAKSYIGEFVLLTIMGYPMLILGLVFFIIPGVYFMIPLALAFPLYFFKKTGKIEGIKAAFKLTSGYWWVTFGTILVVGIVIGIISFVFQLPGVIYLGGKTFVAVQDGGEAFGGDFIYLILATVSAAASNLLSVIFTVALGLIYFDLDEEKNRTGLRAKLDDLG
jgi:hypothetical protein